MKKIVIMFLVLAVAFAATPAFSQDRAGRGASATAMEKASDQAIFHRVSDWFATRGKTPEEARDIRVQRQAERTAVRAQKQAEKQKAAMQKQAEKLRQGMGAGSRR
jgi:CRISPR/Cas system CMR-associated protein Cmr5 small subunit